jgi:hypothetical protein
MITTTAYDCALAIARACRDYFGLSHASTLEYFNRITWKTAKERQL